jgi:NAD(P)-dependent dehydrogenase (short-subunit alcohol dehydrogenase family)
MTQCLVGKVAVATRATTGIGAAIAQMYASEGARVVVNDHRSEEQGKNVVQEIKSERGKSLLVVSDITVAGGWGMR